MALIPKIIHQIWYQGCHQIPMKYYDNIDKIKKYSPGWQYKCWDAVSLYEQCKQYSTACASLFKEYSYMHQKIDLARYVLLYNLGGIYIDMDCIVIKSLNLIPGLDTKDLIVSETPTNEFENLLTTGDKKLKLLNNGVIIASPNNKYLKDLINTIIQFGNCSNKKNPILWNKQACIFRSTGPLMFTKVLNKYREDSQVSFLNHIYFEPCYSMDPYCKLHKDTIIYHKHELTWMNKPMTHLFKTYMHCKKHYDIAVLLALVIILMLVTTLFL